MTFALKAVALRKGKTCKTRRKRKSYLFLTSRKQNLFEYGNTQQGKVPRTNYLRTDS